jgi:hypothetical protein
MGYEVTSPAREFKMRAGTARDVISLSHRAVAAFQGALSREAGMTVTRLWDPSL